MTINLTIPKKETELKPRIVVFGVGGAGGNAVNNMIKSNLGGVDFVVANTDAQSLALSQAERKIQMGITITEGLGAGSRPDIGRAAAEEGIDEILDVLSGTHMAFITAGMGGGTGTGGAPVIARAARERGVLTVGVVTKPFHFEGQNRMKIAEEGIEELQQFVDTLIIIPNQNLFRVANEKTTFADAFGMADDVLYSGVRGVTDLMVMPGLINLDFADIRTVMSEMGKAMMGTGEAEGEGRAIMAAEAAISNPLLDEISMKGARGVLINITGGDDLTLFETDEAANRIREEVDPNANIIFGSTFDESLDGMMRVSVVATGIDVNAMIKPRPTTISLVADNAAPRRAAPAPQPAPQPASQPVAAAEPMPEPVEENFDIPFADTAESEPEGDTLVLDNAIDDIEPAVAEAEESAAPPAEEPAYIVPPAAERAVRPEPEIPAEPFAEADMVNATRAETATEPAPKPAAARASLFRRVTQVARDLADGGDDEKPAARRSEPAMTAARKSADVQSIQPRLGGMDERAEAGRSQSEEDLLEIPAFLRRQAN